MDISLDPFQRKHLVEETVVAAAFVRRFSGQFGTGHKAKATQTVTNAGHDDGFASSSRPRSQFGAFSDATTRGGHRVAAAVYIHLM